MPSTDPLITVQDMRDATMDPFPDEAAEEQKQLQFFIRFASGKARQGVRRTSGLDLDDGLANGTLDRDLMIGTMTVAVLRALETWRNGIGVRNRQYLEESTEYAPDASASSLVYFTEDEIADLTPASTSSGPGESFSITPPLHPVGPSHRWFPRSGC